MTYNPTDDYLPPRKQHLDDVIVTDPQLGDVPFWKALLWNTAHLRQAMMRADAVIERQRHHDDQPVKPSGSDESKPPPVATEQTPVIHSTDPEIVKALQHACNKLSARLDRIEAERGAEQALDDLEEAIEKGEVPPPKEPQTKH